MEQLLGRQWGSEGSSQWIEDPDHEGGDHIFVRAAGRVFSSYVVRMNAGESANVVSGQLSLTGTTGVVEVGISEAVASLDDIAADAREMGYDVPSEAVVAEAKRILLEMSAYRMASYDAYAMSDGRVAVAADGGFGNSMLVVCEPGGSALCVVTEDLVSRHAEYEAVSFLPDDFVRQALRKLATHQPGPGLGR